MTTTHYHHYIDSSRTSFWGGAYTVRKLKICVRKLCVPTKRTESKLQFKVPLPIRFIKQLGRTKMFLKHDARFPLMILVYHPWSFAPCVVWDVSVFACTVRIASMILRTARFIWLHKNKYLYAEICINAIAVLIIIIYVNSQWRGLVSVTSWLPPHYNRPTEE